MNTKFTTNEFALQIISSGSFLDDDASFEGKIFLAEATTVRLNGIAMNEWIDAQIHNCRQCYDSDQEWQDYLSLKEERTSTFKRKIATIVGYDAPPERIVVTNVISEIFTVVYIHEVQKG